MAWQTAAHAPSIAVEATYELVDEQSRVIDDITWMISADHAGKIQRILCAPIPGLAKFTAIGNLHWPTARIRVSETITDTITGDSLTAPLGVYVPTTPDRLVGPTNEDIFEVHGVDLLYYLDQPLDRTWQVTDGADLATSIDDLVAAAGVRLPVALAPVLGTVRGSRIWPLDEEYRYLEIANDLLRSAAWNDLYTTGSGIVTSEPWQPARNITPSLHLDSTRADTLLAETGRVREDTFGVPNRWVVVDSSLAADGTWPQVGAGVAVVSNQSDGPTSIDQRGYVRTRRIETEADSQAALEAIADRESIADRRPSQTVCATITPTVSLWHGDVITVTAPAVGLDQSPMLVSSWTTPLQAGTDMRLELERI